ncbi:MAG: hypothetical protein NC293_02200 [Roseburia sp.]|nr:hypothetical protein [Roseburia sp.]
MQEITYEDIIQHYRLKIEEIYEELERMRQALTDMQKQLPAAWSGDNAELLQEKMWEIHRRFERAHENLSDVKLLLEQFQMLTEQ